MRFSILIPAYKTAFLDDCLNSILRQTYQDFELIIVDDASPNDVYGVVSNHSDHRIKYYRNENGYGAYNLVKNWNKCLEYATGEYVICMGDDDMLDPNCLKYYDDAITRYPEIDVFHGRTTIVNDAGKTTAKLPTRDEVESIWEYVWFRWNVRRQFIGDFLFKREALIISGGFYFIPLAWGSDDITVAMMIGEKGIVNINYFCFLYRDNGKTVTNTSSPSIKIDAIVQEEKWYNKMFENHSHSDDDPYYKMVVEMAPKYFLKKRISMMKYDFVVNRHRLLYWLKNKNKYGFSSKMVIYGWIMGIIGRRVNSYN